MTLHIIFALIGFIVGAIASHYCRKVNLEELWRKSKKRVVAMFATLLICFAITPIAFASDAPLAYIIGSISPGTSNSVAGDVAAGIGLKPSTYWGAEYSMCTNGTGLNTYNGIDVLGYLPIKATGISVYGGAGYYSSTTSQINTISTTTGTTTVTTTSTGNPITWQAGIEYDNSIFLVGAGYHSMRGIDVKLGFSFNLMN